MATGDLDPWHRKARATWVGQQNKVEQAVAWVMISLLLYSASLPCQWAGNPRRCSSYWWPQAAHASVAARPCPLARAGLRLQAWDSSDNLKNIPSVLVLQQGHSTSAAGESYVKQGFFCQWSLTVSLAAQAPESLAAKNGHKWKFPRQWLAPGQGLSDSCVTHYAI